MQITTCFLEFKSRPDFVGSRRSERGKSFFKFKLLCGNVPLSGQVTVTRNPFHYPLWLSINSTNESHSFNNPQLL